MKYIVRKEGLSWTVRGPNGHHYAARRTHADAINWANTLATYAHRARWRRDIARIHASLERMEQNR